MSSCAADITAAGTPAQGLDRDTQIFFEANRVGDVPAVEAETELAAVRAYWA